MFDRDTTLIAEAWRNLGPGAQIQSPVDTIFSQQWTELTKDNMKDKPNNSPHYWKVREVYYDRYPHENTWDPKSTGSPKTFEHYKGDTFEDHLETFKRGFTLNHFTRGHDEPLDDALNRFLRDRLIVKTDKRTGWIFLATKESAAWEYFFMDDDDIAFKAKMERLPTDDQGLPKLGSYPLDA